MIKYIKGDLFSTEHKYIAHGCNAQGVMGKGIALQIRNLYPIAYNAYKALPSYVLGTVQFVESKDKVIINCLTQYDYSKYYSPNTRFVSYDAVAQCFKKINDLIPGETVAMPQIGAGLGGGDWNVIEAIIESELNEVQCVVYTL